MDKKLIIVCLITSFLIAGYASASWFTDFFRTEPVDLGASVIRVPQGGTGATSFTSGECLVGAGTGAITTATCGGGGEAAWEYNSAADAMITTSTKGIMLTASSSIGADFRIDGNSTTTGHFAITGLDGSGGDLKISADGSLYIGSDADSGAGTGSNWEFGGADFIRPTTTVGFIISASSTVQGNFNIDGNATSTGHLASLGGNSDEWNTAYGWGDHASGGYYAAANFNTDWAGQYNATTTLSGFTNNQSNWNTAYTHSQTTTGNPHSLDYADIGLSSNQVIDWTGASAGTIHATNYVDNNTTYTVSATGLELSGTDVIWSAGYAGLKTASSTNWNTFYNTPSNRITAGTNLAWTGNTLDATDTNTTYTGGDGLTLTGTDFDCDISSGSVFGCLSSANWTTFNNKQTAFSTIAGLNAQFTGESVASTTHIWDDAYVSNTLTVDGYMQDTDIDTFAELQSWAVGYTDNNTTYLGGTNLTLVDTTFNVDDVFVLTAGDTMTGGLTMTSATTSQSAYFTEYTTCNLDTDANGLLICGTDADTTYLGGTNLTLDGTTFNVDDAFLKNNADDTTTGGITMGSATTTDSMYVGGDLFITGNNDYSDLIASDIPDISATYSVLAGNASLVTTGTLTTGATGAGFTLDFTNSTLSGNITDANIADRLTLSYSTTTNTMTIPQGASITTANAGEIGIDTTSNQFKYFGTAQNVLVPWKAWGGNFASTTLATAGATTTLADKMAIQAETFVTGTCFVDTGTTTIACGDGTNISYFDCPRRQADAVANNKFTFSSNNTFTADEYQSCNFGNSLGSPTRVSWEIKRTINAD